MGLSGSTYREETDEQQHPLLADCGYHVSSCSMLLPPQFPRHHRAPSNCEPNEALLPEAAFVRVCHQVSNAFYNLVFLLRLLT